MIDEERFMGMDNIVRAGPSLKIAEETIQA